MDFHVRHITDKPGINISAGDYASTAPSLLPLNRLSEQEQIVLRDFVSERRKCEFFYTRLLWRQLCPGEEIQYDANGMPFTANRNLSISHSGNTVVIGWSQISRIGVDIEKCSEKVIRIADKFMSSSEKKRFGTADVKTLTVLWSAKESFFKMFSDEHLKFATQIEILRLGENPLAQISHVRGGLQYPFHVIESEETVITWTTSA